MKRSTILSRLAILAVSCYSTSCLYKELPTGFDCAKSDLGITLVSKQDASSCKSIDGRIEMSATGGIGAYDFSLGDGVYQTNPVFDRLAPGSYLVTVKDLNNCKQSVQVEVGAANSTLAATTSATPDNQCLSNNGSITVTPSGGTGPYLLKIDNGTFAAASTFSNLSNGNHAIIVKDSEDCERVLIVTVPRGSTGVSYANEIVPIFNANCNFSGCHGAGTTGRDWTNFNDVKAKAHDIKSRTASRSMPIGGFVLTTDEIQKIGCWVDDGANQN
jgi:hypothetical protein